MLSSKVVTAPKLRTTALRNQRLLQIFDLLAKRPLSKEPKVSFRSRLRAIVKKKGTVGSMSFG